MAGSMWIFAKNKKLAIKKARDIIDTKKYTTGVVKHSRTFKNRNKEWIVYTRKKRKPGKKKKGRRK